MDALFLKCTYFVSSELQITKTIGRLGHNIVIKLNFDVWNHTDMQPTPQETLALIFVPAVNRKVVQLTGSQQR
jgi:hypothetical protein